MFVPSSSGILSLAKKHVESAKPRSGENTLRMREGSLSTTSRADISKDLLIRANIAAKCLVPWTISTLMCQWITELEKKPLQKKLKLNLQIKSKLKMPLETTIYWNCQKALIKCISVTTPGIHFSFIVFCSLRGNQLKSQKSDGLSNFQSIPFGLGFEKWLKNHNKLI